MSRYRLLALLVALLAGLVVGTQFAAPSTAGPFDCSSDDGASDLSWHLHRYGGGCGPVDVGRVFPSSPRDAVDRDGESPGSASEPSPGR
ncbi:hypothetical protein [Halomicrococcus sp. SG-WS-1]|uniref:hypothetical protein n=1 Tax=Halomicrococcus sp. SG-WS-1 TaxID=3439057 RepID=UPI003F7B16E1